MRPTPFSYASTTWEIPRDHLTDHRLSETVAAPTDVLGGPVSALTIPGEAASPMSKWAAAFCIMSGGGDKHGMVRARREQGGVAALPCRREGGVVAARQQLALPRTVQRAAGRVEGGPGAHGCRGRAPRP